MIDLHAHLLPGVDDGPVSPRDAVAMARAAWEAGTGTVVCTPHMAALHPTPPARVHAGVAALADALEREGVPLRLLPGGEIDISHLRGMGEEEVAAASIGGGGRWLLLEMPVQGWPIGLPDLLASLEIRGYGVVLAHPERSESIQRSPDRLRDLVGRGALAQLTAGSFTGDYGPAARRTAARLLAGGMGHILASDAHSAGPWRGPGLGEGLEAAAAAVKASPQALRWMVEDGPAEILEGGHVRPPRLTPSRRPPGGGRPAPSATRLRTRG